MISSSCKNDNFIDDNNIDGDINIKVIDNSIEKIGNDNDTKNDFNNIDNDIDFNDFTFNNIGLDPDNETVWNKLINHEGLNDVEKIKKMRISLTPDQKASCLDIWKQVNDDFKENPYKKRKPNDIGMSEAVRIINSRFTNYKISPKHLRNWMKKRNNTKNIYKMLLDEFENDLINRCIFFSIDNNGNNIKIEANLFYSYSVLKSQAMIIQQLPRYNDKKCIAELKFSDCWCNNFFNRNQLFRRKVTHTEKKSPSESEIKNYITDIQKIIKDKNINQDTILNLDQCGIFFQKNLDYQFLPRGVKRAVEHCGNDKLRITLQTTVSANGIFFPPFIIAKNTVVGSDHSRSTVLGSIKEKLDDKDDWVEKVFKYENGIRKLLVNKQNNAVITADSNAWADKLTFLIYIKYQLEPFIEKYKNSKVLLILDGFSVHKSQEVQQHLNQLGILYKHLPPNSSHLLQPLDLAFHRPLKAHLEKTRINEILAYTESWFHQYSRDICMDRQPAKHRPEPQQLHKTISILTDFVLTNHLQDSLKVTFSKLGLVLNGEDGNNLEVDDVMSNINSQCSIPLIDFIFLRKYEYFEEEI